MRRQEDLGSGICGAVRGCDREVGKGAPWTGRLLYGGEDDGNVWARVVGDLLRGEVRGCGGDDWQRGGPGPGMLGMCKCGVAAEW